MRGNVMGIHVLCAVRDLPPTAVLACLPLALMAHPMVKTNYSDAFCRCMDKLKKPKTAYTPLAAYV
jgi:hypothetical protein